MLTILSPDHRKAVENRILNIIKNFMSRCENGMEWCMYTGIELYLFLLNMNALVAICKGLWALKLNFVKLRT